MSLQKIGAITQNTLIPISLVIVFGTIIYFIGGLATKVDAIQSKDSPSRDEYNQMFSQLNKIETKIDTVNTTLLKFYSKDLNVK